MLNEFSEGSDSGHSKYIRIYVGSVYVCTYIGYVLARVAFRFQTKLYFTDVQLEMLQVVLYNQLRAELSTK